LLSAWSAKAAFLKKKDRSCSSGARDLFASSKSGSRLLVKKKHF